MRVLHIISARDWRGGEQQAATLIEECQERNVPCHVICPPQSAFSEYCKQNEIPHHEFIQGGLLNILNSFVIYYLCRSLKIDVMHVHSSGAHTKSILINFGHKRKIPVVVSRRVTSPIRNRWFTRYKYNQSFIKKIICSSDNIKSLVQKSVANPERCVTIYDSVNVNRFMTEGNPSFLESHGLKDTDYLVSCIAELEPNKDIDTFIEAARLAIKQDSQATFLIIGKGWRKPDLQHKIEELGLQNRVILTDFLEDITDALPFIKINVLCSRREGLGTALLEAMASNVAVIGSNTGGIPEVITDSETGYLVDVCDAENLALKILDLEHDYDKRLSFIKKAMQHLHRNFLSSVMAERTLSIYLEATKVIS